MKKQSKCKSKCKKNLGKKIFLLSAMAMLFIGCGEQYSEKGSEVYINEINEWHQKRINNLKLENGWLNLVGLYWLKQGENRFGSDKNNDIVFPPDAPAKIGKFILQDSIVTVEISPEVTVTHDGEKIQSAILDNDLSEKVTKLKTGSFIWFIIKRGDKYGVRLRNLEAPLVKSFEGIERFPVNEEWKITAEFIPYDSPKEILVPNILGEMDKEFSSGKIKLQIDGKDFEITPVDAGEKLFIIFADETSGEETYGAGRFLYADKPDSSNKVILDFNKAYNPPCVFTPFATCPLPLKENYLKVRITAGEKNWGEH